ncbi:L7Ae/L30e/S12e/Gadd45 family ribosomal protein [Inediibacterium massiliense]|uniref:L7Ae/L30e/S12e/Gadd45 family ribosomal protein n=1 Tax=Inediibacterium massiliense TaxID=1658111 RepID=UPI0006B54DA1|nr:ribosomal L7Ae/L30e/S12e/Gadd45 family protein [Inediibacterium massiliense]
MENKIFSFLGLAQRSGQLVTGEDTCTLYAKKKAIQLIIIPQDASENTKKKFKDMANHRNIPFLIYANRESLSKAVGKSNRTVYGIKDKGFATKILSLVQDEKECPNHLGGE